jgi:hypothetical protein
MSLEIDEELKPAIDNLRKTALLFEGFLAWQSTLRGS